MQSFKPNNPSFFLKLRYKHGMLIASLYVAIISIVIMVLLQPFGLDRVEENKYLIIMGYGAMASFAYAITDAFTTYVLHMPRKGMWENKRGIINAIIINPLMGAFISTYAGWVYSGDPSNGWIDQYGNFTLHSFWINTGYSMAISFFVSLFFYLRSRTETLSLRLKEEIELNHILEEKAMQEKQQTKEHLPQTKEPHLPLLTLQGNTKEMLELHPSDLLYIESEGNYVHIHYILEGKGTKKTLRCTMKQMETAVESFPDIIRCHRAFLVNISQVTHVDGNAQGYRLHLNNVSETVPVSRAYASTVYERIEG